MANRSPYATKPPFGTPLNQSHPLASSLALAYLFNENGGMTANDGSKSNNPATFGSSQVTWDRGIFGPCLNFSGAGFSYIVSSKNLTDTGAITLSCWVWAASYNQSGMFIEKASVNADWEYFVQQGTGGTVFLRGSSATAVTVGSLVDGKWFHVAATIAGTVGTLFFNGVQVATGAVTAIGTTSSLVSIGCYDHANAQFNFAGKIDVPMVWTRALTPTDIRALYASPFQMYLKPRRRMIAGAAAAAVRPWWTCAEPMMGALAGGPCGV